MMLTPTLTISDIALSVANDIERLGHYRPTNDGSISLISSRDDENQPCCVVRNPTLNPVRYRNLFDVDDASDSTEMLDMVHLDAEFQRALEEYVVPRFDLDPDYPSIISWSDTTPTPILLATLREFAASLSTPTPNPMTKDSA